MPKLVIRGLGLFMPFMREVPEMIYQWEQPYVLDDSRFVSTFGWSATPVDDAVAASDGALGKRTLSEGGLIRALLVDAFRR